MFCWTLVWTRYRFARRSGYQFFFMAALAGTGLLSVVYVPVRLVEMYVPYVAPVFTWWHEFVPDAGYVGTCMLSLLLSWPAAKIINRWIDGAETRRNEIQEHGDELEQMIMDAVTRAYERPQLYLFTLTSGKVYIGTIMSENDPYGRRRYITLLKFASGYRDEDQQVKITTPYAAALKRVGEEASGPTETINSEDEEDDSEEHDTEVNDAEGSAIPAHITENDFQVVIPKNELLMLSRYEPELKSFFPNGPQMQ